MSKIFIEYDVAVVCQLEIDEQEYADLSRQEIVDLVKENWDLDRDEVERVLTHIEGIRI